MQRYRKLSVLALALALGAAALVLLIVTAYSYRLASWPPLRLVGAVLALFTILLSLASMLIEPCAMLCILCRWKT
ncbi:hypothetical protein [Trinickia soli]|nr:hypothetical protein [Trinickia soli]CAB3666838.1 hypothetical protein LMG24076_01743 [Trinickia soli]